MRAAWQCIGVCALGWGSLWSASSAALDQRGLAARQLAHLEQALDKGAATRMQLQFPEGYVLTWALYGLAAVQLAQAQPAGDPQRTVQLERARAAVRALDRPAARATFDASLQPPYGAFYAGWSLLLRGKLRCMTAAADSGLPLEQYRADLDALAAAFRSNLSHTPFLPSYRGQAWPADSVAGMAALALAERCDRPRHAGLLADWLRAARQRREPRWQALPHAVDAQDGSPLGPPRGSSLALMSLLLADLDPALAAQQYAVLRTHFLARPLPGLVGMREYPDGVEGAGDIDSGPLLLGLSGPATVVGAGTALAQGDQATASALLAMAEIYGAPSEAAGRRTYLGGALPVGEAFLAWARSVSAAPDTAAEQPPPGLQRLLWLATLPAPLAGLAPPLWLLAAVLPETVCAHLVSARCTGALLGDGSAIPLTLWFRSTHRSSACPVPVVSPVPLPCARCWPCWRPAAVAHRAWPRIRRMPWSWRATGCLIPAAARSPTACSRAGDPNVVVAAGVSADRTAGACWAVLRGAAPRVGVMDGAQVVAETGAPSMVVSGNAVRVQPCAPPNACRSASTAPPCPCRPTIAPRVA